MASTLDCPIEPLCPDSLEPFLPSRINLGEDQAIGSIEGRQKLIEEITGTAIAVGLKDHRQRATPAIANGQQGCLNFGRMVPVVVDHHNPPRALP